MNSKEIFKALQERNRFLEKHPELKPMQKYIDDTLRKAGSQHNRIVILNRLIHDNVGKLRKELLELQKMLEVIK